MPKTIAIEIPDAIADKYESTDKLELGLFEDIIIREHQKGNLSIRECARFHAIGYEDFLVWLGEREVSFVNATEQELDASYNDFENFMQMHERS